MEELSKLYYDTATGYVSADKLFLKAKQLGLKVSKKEVNEFVKKQETAQLNKK
jgi:Ca2+-binding EF-hand superfamily protein